MGLVKKTYIIYIFIIVVFLSGCGGSGGSDVSTIPVINSTSNDVDSFPLKVLFIDSEKYNLSPVKRDISKEYLTINGEKYYPNLDGYIDNLSIKNDVLINVNDNLSFKPDFNKNEGLFLKVMNKGEKYYLLRVYFKPESGSGIALRSSIIYKNDTKETVLNGDNEKVAGENFSELLGRYISKVETKLSDEIEELPLLNNENILKNYSINPFAGIGFTGEIKLVLEPTTMTLDFNQKGQFVSKVVDEAGTSAIIQAHWTAYPPELIDLDNTGQALAKEVPGIINITAQFENLFAYATVEVVMPDGDNTISGIINSDKTLTADTLHLISGDLIIKEGVTLTIEGGTQIHFIPKVDSTGSGENSVRSEIIVNGTLVTKGFKTRHTQLLSHNRIHPDSTDYFGIVVNSTGVVDLDYCNIEDAIYGIKCNGGKINITHSIINNCQVGISIYDRGIGLIESNEIVHGVLGIESNLAGNTKILRNYIADNSFNGITIYNSNPIIYGNIILRNRNVGISVNTLSYPTIKNSIISTSGIYGVTVSKLSAPVFENNIIDHNQTSGFKFDHESRPVLINNIIYANYMGIQYRDDSELIFQYNNSSSSKISNYLNLDGENDRVMINGEMQYIHFLPNVYGENPEFKNSDFINPNIGDFSLVDGSFLLTAGKNTSSVGLLDPIDIGTSSVKFGEDVF